MTPHEQLAHAVAHLADIQADIRRNGEDRPEQWRLRMVNLRRDLALQMGEAGTLIGTIEKLGVGAEVEREVRQRFAVMRTTIALHQSKWPAVSVDYSDKEFAKSATEVANANATFAKWINALISRTAKQGLPK